MYAIRDTSTGKLEDDGDGFTVYRTDKSSIDKEVADANSHPKAQTKYEVVEAHELDRYSLINDFILIRPGTPVEKCLEYALEEAPDRAGELASIRDKILSMPIAIEEPKPLKSTVVDYRVERLDKGSWGDSGFNASGLFYDPIEMMREVVEVVGDEIKARLGEDENFYDAMKPFQVVVCDIGTEPLTHYLGHYNLVNLNDCDRIIFGNDKKGIPKDTYEIEAIETESGKIETSGSIVVLAGPGGATYAVHAGDFLDGDLHFLKKPEKKSRFQP
jgi:hypothetical protein